MTDFNALRTPGRHVMSVRIDDYDRKFIFITPSNPKPGQNLPLVFFFHGAGGTAAQASRTYGWTEKAEAGHFFMVLPEGLPVRPESEGSFLLNPHIWRDERPALKVSPVNDVHFFEELLQRIEDVLPVDTHRVYVTGFSNGAGLTFTLGSHFSDRIAAIAPVSSQSFIHIDALARPLPVYYLTGTADPLIPYHGGSVKLPWGNTRTTPPVQESVDTWAKLDGCPPQPQIVSDAGGVHVLRYGPGTAGAEVLFTTIDGIWEFFKAHPLP